MLTACLAKFRIWIIAAWALIALFGFSQSASLNSHLSSSLSVPHTQSEIANGVVQKHFGENIEGAFTVIYHFKQATPAEIAVFEEKISSAVRTIPGAVVTQQRAVAGTLYSSIQTEQGLMSAAELTGDLRLVLTREGLQAAQVTGAPALAHDLKPILSRDLLKGELLALIIALIFLIGVLGLSWTVLIPFLVAGATIGSAIALLNIAAQKTLIVLYTPNLIELLALGLAIDYTLLLVQRYRVETHEESPLQRTMATAGKTVLLSGSTVAIAIAILLFIPIPFIRSLGLAGVLVPLLSLATSLTLTPALLAVLGPKRVQPRIFQGLLVRIRGAEGLWNKLAHVSITYPKRVLVATLLPLLFIASLVVRIDVTPSSTFALPTGIESGAALKVLAETVGAGAITPNEIVVDLGRDGAAQDPLMIKARLDFAARLSQIPESFAVVTSKKPPLVDLTGRFIRIFIIGHHELGAPETKALVKLLREKYITHAGFPAGAKVYLAGAPAQGVDYIHLAYSAFLWATLGVLLLVFFLLFIYFRSWKLPLITIAFNALSVAIAAGSLVPVFIWGWGKNLFGLYQVNQIEAWVPIFLFAILFGLSMDYQLFIVLRIREARASGESHEGSIRLGLVKTGAVVTSAAVILIGALSGLCFGSIASLQELGVGVALGLLLDAFIIRSLVLPATLTLLGSKKPRL